MTRLMANTNPASMCTREATSNQCRTVISAIMDIIVERDRRIKQRIESRPQYLKYMGLYQNTILHHMTETGYA